VRRAPLAVALLIALAAATPAAATVPPRDCKTMRADGKRYGVKSHMLRCPTARRYARKWLDTRKRPQGWSCTQPRDTALKLHCTRGIRTFFVIRR
jgi:hypothetical protein